ncbi:MAG: T9SS type A sorting domain-containing protein, partial [Crocinitomicaceae bacterium]|nr:T9SS type A sorting domain-containing protein [Crocinitomicaceae bacterium]
RIYSVTGQIVRELKFNSTKMIDMTGVDKGVYIVRDMETGDMMEIVLI